MTVVALLEWLTSDDANAHFAALTLEFPVNPGSATDASIAAWSGFEACGSGFSRDSFHPVRRERLIKIRNNGTPIIAVSAPTGN